MGVLANAEDIDDVVDHEDYQERVDQKCRVEFLSSGSEVVVLSAGVGCGGAHDVLRGGTHVGVKQNEVGEVEREHSEDPTSRPQDGDHTTSLGGLEILKDLEYNDEEEDREDDQPHTVSKQQEVVTGELHRVRTVGMALSADDWFLLRAFILEDSVDGDVEVIDGVVVVE